MKKTLLPLFAMLACALFLAACGDSTPQPAGITPEQKKVVDDMDKVTKTAQTAIDDAKKSADAAKDDVKKAIDAAETALKDAKTAIAKARAGGNFDDLKAKAETAMTNLQAKLTELAAKVKPAIPAMKTP